MNTFTSYPTTIEQAAEHTVADRVRDAEHRALVRRVRAERRTARRTAQTAPDRSIGHLTARAFRFAHPVH